MLMRALYLYNVQRVIFFFHLIVQRFQSVIFQFVFNTRMRDRSIRLVGVIFDGLVVSIRELWVLM